MPIQNSIRESGEMAFRGVKGFAGRRDTIMFRGILDNLEIMFEKIKNKLGSQKVYFISS